MTSYDIEDRIARLISPAAPCFSALSSGEQKMAKYMIEYLTLMKEQLKLDFEKVWERCEPEFREYVRKPPQNACVIDPVNFEPVRRDALNTPSFNIESLDDHLKEMIAFAVMKTQEIIGKHEWLKTDTMPRNARIGHFVTNLRRDLTIFIARIPDDIKDVDATLRYSSSGSLKGFLQKFYDADMWSDVGVPRQYNGYGSDGWKFSCVYNNRMWRMDANRIAELCGRALEMSPQQEASKSIEESLASLQRDMYPLKSTIDKMNRLNTESDQIIGNLCAIVEGK